MKTAEIRQAFLSYFKKNGHKILPSSSLIPKNDRSLLFVNAGMVPFKHYFLGNEQPPAQTLTTSQRCVRAGGKHNDLENVGYTARHHTFFEMLGNFSFGDYFKEQAIRYAWSFLVDELKISPKKLWVTVYKDDQEAADIWLHKIGVESDRFSYCGEEDNFWAMGKTGPCGPCTEIFYDHGDHLPGNPPGSEEEGGERYIEIWNVVFMQYERLEDGELKPLTSPCVDTGMGLERISAVMQGVQDNYDTDLFQSLLSSVRKILNSQSELNSSMKVIADHIRSSAFLIADGIEPSNEGRGYVLRRIIRRAIRHGHKLGASEPFFYRLVSALVGLMGEAYPLLKEQSSYIETVLKREEMQFSQTLAVGMRHLEKALENVQESVISGEIMFKLYDTYGFPVDLLSDIAREREMQLDLVGYEKAMSEQRQRAQAASQFITESSLGFNVELPTEFVGYHQAQYDTKILGMSSAGKPQDSDTQVGSKLLVVLEKTPFYAESGGQVGDKGCIENSDMCIDVYDTQVTGGVYIHHGVLKEGVVRKGMSVTARVNDERRSSIRRNHSATHLLHAALKSILGSHVTQKGSHVDDNRLRFDFYHPESLDLSLLQKIETLVNEYVVKNKTTTIDFMSMETAQESGAVALFDEKYGDEVRVITMGDFSKELCGGTHVVATGDIGLFKLISHKTIGSNIHRMEALTGFCALQWLHQAERTLHQIAGIVQSDVESVAVSIEKKVSQIKLLEKQNQRLLKQHAELLSQSFARDPQPIGDKKLFIGTVVGSDASLLRPVWETLKAHYPQQALAVLIALDKPSDRCFVLVSMTKDCIGQLPKAAEILKYFCEHGGGRADQAQGSGPIPADLDERLDRLKQSLQ